MVKQIVNGSLDRINAAGLLSEQEAATKEVARDLGKKKRMNRSAKLKQCKLDARREQWLSQGNLVTVKDKGRKVMSEISSPLMKRKGSPETSDFGRDGMKGLHDTSCELPMNSSAINVPGNRHCGLRRERPGTISSSSSSGSSFSGSTSMSDDDGDNTCFDDWEAVADALGTDDLQKPSIDPSAVDLKGPHSAPADGKSQKNSSYFSTEVASERILGLENKGKPICLENNRVERRTTCRAWRADDASRPPSLPTLSKQLSFPSERRHSRVPMNWVGNGINSSTLSHCPICYEDLDLTDCSFLPCSCGFRLCLFCHKKILEVDGRCPGCRKPYMTMDEDARGSSPSITCLSRSCSMRLGI